MNCPCCQREIVVKATSRSRTCGKSECVEWWRSVGRYQDDDQNRLAQARHVLNHPEKYSLERVMKANDDMERYGG